MNRQKRSRTVVYVSNLTLLTEILKRDEVLHELKVNRPVKESGQYKSCLDGDYFKRNPILSNEDVSLCITLYTDDFEICNPLGTSKKTKTQSLQCVLGSCQFAKKI